MAEVTQSKVIAFITVWLFCNHTEDLRSSWSLLPLLKYSHILHDNLSWDFLKDVFYRWLSEGNITKDHICTEKS